jgi:hypothetical protein
MADVKLPFIRWRDGRPRFHPSGRELELGFAGEDLKHEDGTWYTLQEAELWSAKRLVEIREVRASGRPRELEVERGDTVADLIADWLAALERRRDDALDPVPEATLRTYRGASAALIFKPETREAGRLRRQREQAARLTGVELPERERELFGQAPVSAIDKIRLNEMYLHLKRTRGPHMAKLAIAAFSAAYTWGGLDRRWRLGANPRNQIKMPDGKGRIMVWSDLELVTMIETADAMGKPSIGDAIVLGIFSAQRQRDRLELEDAGLVDGRRQFRQSKTGVLVPIREAPQLVSRLAAAKVRVRELALRHGTRPTTVVVDEGSGRAYVQATYRGAFGAVRAVAALRIPRIAQLRDQDLRDTAVTWLARSGAQLLEICMVTGHSPRSVQTIMRHYLGEAPELGDAAIDKLVAWMRQEGMRLSG